MSNPTMSNPLSGQLQDEYHKAWMLAFAEVAGAARAHATAARRGRAGEEADALRRACQPLYRLEEEWAPLGVSAPYFPPGRYARLHRAALEMARVMEAAWLAQEALTAAAAAFEDTPGEGRG